MASAEIPEGVYRLLGQHGCLSGGSPDAPLNLLPHGEHGHQLWEVKKHQNDQYTITSKDKPEMGITHPKEVQHMELVKLGSPPRAFKIQPMPDGPMPNMFKIIPVEVEKKDLVMTLAPFMVYPPLVGLVPKEMSGESGWRFERA